MSHSAKINSQALVSVTRSRLLFPVSAHVSSPADPKDTLAGGVEVSPGRAPVLGGPGKSNPLANTEQVKAHQKELATQVAESVVASGGAREQLFETLRRRWPSSRGSTRNSSSPPNNLDKRNALTASSPAKFLRINPALFYEDLKGVYADKSRLLGRKAPVITIAGDCHLGNLGNHPGGRR